MAKINKDDLIDGIAQDYVDNSGDTATITFGNLRPKLDTAVYPKGTLEITSNGQHNVRTYENVDVEVPQPTGTIEITENGTYNIFDYAQAEVDVPTGGALLNSVTRNADGTYTVIDADNVSHTVVPTETDGQITSITFDGNIVPLSFSNGELISVGDTNIDVSRYVGETLKNKLIYYNDFNGHTNIKSGYTVELKPDNSHFSITNISNSKVNSSKAAVLADNSGQTVQVDILGDTTSPYNFTIGGWFYAASSNYATSLMVFPIVENSTLTIRLFDFAGKFKYDKPSSWSMTSDSISTDSSYWHHIAATGDMLSQNPSISFYVDGHPFATIYSSSTQTIEGLSKLSISRTTYHYSNMTSIFVADEILTISEIQELMTSTEIFT